MADPKRRLPDWSALPADALFAISNHIPDDADYTRFRSVCTSFRSAAPNRPHLPWILLLEGDNIDSLTLGLYNFPNPEPSAPPRLPEGLARGKSVCGSSHGWIALLDDAPGISLHNPFTGAHTRLPPLSDLPWASKYAPGFLEDVFDDYGDFRNVSIRMATKIVLSSPDITAVDTVILGISCLNSKLISCRPGDGSWTVVPPFFDSMNTINDIVFFRDRFYAMCGYRLFVVDAGLDHYEILAMDQLFSNDRERENHYYFNNTSYLLVSSGDLLLVLNTDADSDKLCWEVFRVDLDFKEAINGKFSLFKLHNLGGGSLFVGERGSVSVSPGTSLRCKPNCIYYIFSETISKFTIAVYSMEDGSVSLVPGFSDDSSIVSDDQFDFSDDGFNIPDDGYSELYWLAPRLCD